jgi:tryptophanyl-tRNA synthetase
LIAWSEGEAKIKSLQQQAAQATGEIKAKLEKRIAEERADHQPRVEKLSKAWQLVKEAAAV